MAEVTPSSKDPGRKGKSKHVSREGAYNQPLHLHPGDQKVRNLKGRSRSKGKG